MVPALREREKGCLKGVFGVLDSREDVPADPEHHRSVPLDQRLEGGLRLFSLAGQELSINCPSDRIVFIRLVNSLSESWSNSAI